MVVSTSNMVEILSHTAKLIDTLSRSVGQLDQKQKYVGLGHSIYLLQTSTENVIKLLKYHSRFIGACALAQ